jgi:NitT/TauT family transport system substrate-binding protein
MIPHTFGLTPVVSAPTRQSYTRRSLLVNSGRAMLIGAGVAAGLGRVRVAGAASKVTIDLGRTPCAAPIYAAAARGFFGDEGLDATTTFSDLGSGGAIAVAAGTVDATMDAIWSIVPPRLTSGHALGDVVVTAALQRGCIALVVQPDSEVQSLEDLRGSNIAGGKFLFGTALAEAGLNPDVDITWSPAPAIADVLPTLNSGSFGAVQTANGQGALLEVAGLGRMVAMNNMPPSENNYCCGCLMTANSVRSDRSKAAAITRAMMRGSAWAEAHRSEMAAIIRPSITEPLGGDLSQEQTEAALAMMAFVPMAEAARPLLVDEFEQYLTYGLPVDGLMDAATVVNRIFVTVTEELQAA